jgi:hypothetical protein
MKKSALFRVLFVVGLSLSTISWAGNMAFDEGQSNPDNQENTDEPVGEDNSNATDENTESGEAESEPDNGEDNSGDIDNGEDNSGNGEGEDNSGDIDNGEDNSGNGEDDSGETGSDNGNGEDPKPDPEPNPDPDPDPEPDPEPIHWPVSMASGTLPIMYINTEDSTEIVDKVTQIPASLWIEVPEGCADTDFALGSAKKPVALTIKGRGNSTWTNFDKKPYKIKFDKKQALLGMPKHKHYALLACASGYTDWFGQVLGKEMAREIGMGWAPNMQPVELVLNGEYWGLYFVTESIKIDSNRLDIYEQPDNNTDSETIPYGWLVELDNNVDEYQIIVQETDTRRLRVTYHSPEELSTEQKTWLTDEFTSMCATLNDPSTRENWVNYIEPTSLVQYFIVREIMTDFDAFNGSVYMYRPQEEGARWHFGPMWDNTIGEFNDPTYWTRDNLPSWAVYRLMSSIMQTQIFQEKFVEVWDEMYNSDLLQQLFSYMHDFGMHCCDADRVNKERWSIKYSVSETNITRLCDLIQTKADWMDENKYYLESSSGLNSVFEDMDVVDLSVRYFTIDGAAVSGRPSHPGVYVKQQIARNGESRVQKVVVR